MVHPIWDPYPEIKQGLEDVREIILSELSPPHPAIYQKIKDYVEAPGKYLRSGLCLLLAQASQGELSKGKLYLAAYIEVLHLATLIHDDVIDQADVRRQLPTIHSQFGNRIAVYTGDYLLVYAARLAAKGMELLQLPMKDQKPKVDQTFLERILVGELAQLLNQFNRQMTMKDYLKQIQGKTALLFGHAFQLGILQAETSDWQLRQAFRAGRALGTAFQLRDDVIDYRLPRQRSGKPRLQDVTNGIYTAPLLLAMRKDQTLVFDLEYLEGATDKGDIQRIILRKIEKTGSIEQTEVLIASYLKKMKTFLRSLESPSQVALCEDLVDHLFADYF